MDNMASRILNNLLQYHHGDYAIVTSIIVHKANDHHDTNSSFLIRVEGTPSLLPLLLGRKQNHLVVSLSKAFTINSTLVFVSQKLPSSQLICKNKNKIKYEHTGT